MKCPSCKNDMHIAARFFTSEVREDGGSDILSVVDLMCMNPQCTQGKKGVPTAREARPVGNADPGGAVACCGIPLCYLGEGGYWLPPGTASSRKGDILAVTCPTCSAQHAVDVAGRDPV